MNKKIIISLITLIFLTGCTVNYDITIDEDLKVDENIDVIGDNRFKITSEYTLESMYDTLKETYSELYKNVDLTNKNLYQENNNISLKNNVKYNDIKAFTNSEFIKIIYSNGLKTTQNNNIIKINSNNQLDNFWLFVDGMEEDPLITKLRVNIKLPFVVISNNADSIDKKTNTYTWNYDFQDSSKMIVLEFNKSKLFTNKIDKKQVIKYILYAFGIILLGYVIFRVVKNRNKNNNKI